MKQCPNCGTEFSGDFCPECGEQWQGEKTCPQCYATCDSQAVYCESCGYRFPTEQATATEPFEKPVPIPESQQTDPQSATRKFLNGSHSMILYRVIRWLPAAFFALFAVLTFAFLAAPTVKINFLGFVNSVNAYECLNEVDTQFLRASIISIIVFAALSVPVSAIMFYAELKSDGMKPNRFNYLAFPIYLAVAFSAAAIISLIKDFDKGTGLVTAGASPILLIVFPLLFALLALLTALVRLWLKYSIPAFSEEIMQERKRYAEQLLNLAPPIPPEPVQKEKSRVFAQPRAVRNANSFVTAKAVLLSILFLLTGMTFIVILMPYKRYNDFYLRTIIAVLIFCILYFIIFLVAILLFARRFKRPKLWNKRERSLKFYIIASAVVFLSLAIALGCCVAIKGGVIGWESYSSYEWFESYTDSGLNYYGFTPSSISLYITIYAIAIAVGIIFAGAICLITAHVYRGSVNKAVYGKRRPRPDTPVKTDFAELNHSYLKYHDKELAYREYRIQKAAYTYERLRYAFGKPYGKKPPRCLLILWTNKLWISLAAVLIAVLVVVPCIVFPVITNMFRAKVVEHCELGSTKNEVGNYLGKGIEENDGYVWKFYSDNYTDILDKIEENEAAATNTEDLAELEKLTAEHTKLKKQLSEITYKYIVVQFEKGVSYKNEWGICYNLFLSHVLLDTARCDSAEYVVKEVRSVRLDRDSVSVEDLLLPDFRLSAQIYYTDGSYQNTYLPASAFSQVAYVAGEYPLAWSDSWGKYQAVLEVT